MPKTKQEKQTKEEKIIYQMEALNQKLDQLLLMIPEESLEEYEDNQEIKAAFEKATKKHGSN